VLQKWGQKAPAAARGFRPQNGERARLVSRPDCPGGLADTQFGAQPAACQGHFRRGLGTVPALGRVLWAAAWHPCCRSPAPLHEPIVLGLWRGGAQVLINQDPRLSALWADPGPGFQCSAADHPRGRAGTGHPARGLGSPRATCPSEWYRGAHGNLTLGDSRAPTGGREAVRCPGWRNQESPACMRAECQVLSTATARQSCLSAPRHPPRRPLSSRHGMRHAPCR
jgi:hypothetical protein